MPQLLVHLLGAKNLIAADSNGLSDPYVKLRVGSSSWKKSKVIPKTLNPNWNESFILPVGNPEIDVLELRVFDRDLIVDDSIANVTLLNLKQGLERELSITLDGVKSGELNIILTALDFGEKKADEATVYSKSRSEHPPLPMPVSLSPGAPKSPRPKSPASPESQPQIPHALQSPPSHAPQITSATAPVAGAPAPQQYSAQQSPPPQAQYPPPQPGQPYPYPYAPPPQPYYPPPPGYAYGYSPAPQVQVAPPPVLAASLTDVEGVKQTPVTDDYEFGKQLGKGAFAVVFEGMRKSDQELFAIKVIEKSRVAGTNVKLLRREVVNLKSLSHPNIMKLYEIYEDPQKFYLILELIKVHNCVSSALIASFGRELFDKIVALGHYSEQDAAHILEQVLSAIAYLHSRGIAHRDLKPENLLSIGSGADEKMKLADFGLSKNFSEEEMSTSCGSPLYVAPEVLTGRGYTKSVDIWSLGVILYILLVGYPPFNGQNAVVLYRQIMHNEWGFGPAWSAISPDARDLVQKMMCQDGTKRVTATEALEHPWIKQRTALSKSPLLLQADLRKTMAQLKAV